MTKNQIKNIVKVTITSEYPMKLKKLMKPLGLIVAFFAFILYAQSIAFNYTMDDHLVIDKNEDVKLGFSGIPIILKTDFLHGFEKGSLSGPIYRPLPLILFASEWGLMPNSPHFYHLMNILLYALSCWILFKLLCAVFKEINLIIPFISCLLYASHPIHTEVVNNIKSADEILCFLFGILSIINILKYCSGGNNILSLMLGCIFFFLSMLSKETGITFLVIIPLTIYFFENVSKKKLIEISVSLIMITLIYVFIRRQILFNININTSYSYLFNTLVSAPSFISREATAFFILLKYLFLLIFPHPLTCDYNYSQIKIQSLGDIGAIAGITIIIALGIYAIWNIKKKSILSYGILIFFVSIAPVCNIFILNGATMAERFLYIPSLGFCIIIIDILNKYIKEKNSKMKANTIKLLYNNNSKLFIIALAIVGLYSIKTFSRSMDWKDEVTLFRHNVEVSDNSATAHYAWGFLEFNEIYLKEKNEEKKKKILENVIKELQKAITIFPPYADAYDKLAFAYFTKGDYQNAIINYEKAMSLDSKQKLKIYNHIAAVYEKTNQLDLKLSMLDSVIKYEPNSAITYYDKGLVYSDLMKDQEALVEFKKALELNPKYMEAYRAAGACNINLKQFQKAIDFLNKASELNDADLQTNYFLGAAYINMGDSIKAKQYFEKANRSKGALRPQPDR